jgi:uncharacterized membrane protein YeiH
VRGRGLARLSARDLTRNARMLLGVIQQAGGEFELPIAFTLLAFFTFGITGALAGLRRGYDFIGVVALAMITAGGGGLIRDGLLLSNGPASIVTNGRYLLVVVVAALLTSLFHRYVNRLSKVIAMVDALGLGAFAVHGVQQSLAAGLSVPAAILGGTLTAVGGGLMRDILVREEPLLFKPGQFYALVAIGGCGLFIALSRWSEISTKEAALITIVVVTTVRLLAIRFNWRTSAVYTEPPETTR